jgi:hypothetical protein
MSRTPWTPEDIATLRDLRGVRGWDCPAIATHLGRTARSVRYKADKLGIALPPTKKRGSTRDDEALREAFAAGRPIKSIAAALGMERTCVRLCYEVFSQQLIEAGPDFTPPGGYIGSREMARIVAPICGATARAILSEGRFRSAVIGRMAISRALRDRGLSLSSIARALGRGDHTTILHGLTVFDAYARKYPRLLEAYQAIKDAEGMAMERLAA